jgi:hypothetical protein
MQSNPDVFLLLGQLKVTQTFLLKLKRHLRHLFHTL